MIQKVSAMLAFSSTLIMSIAKKRRKSPDLCIHNEAVICKSISSADQASCTTAAALQI